MLSKMNIGLYVKYPLFLTILMNLEYSRYILEKYSKIKFHENPCGGSRVVPCRRTYGRTDRYDEAHICLSQNCKPLLKVFIYIFQWRKTTKCTRWVIYNYIFPFWPLGHRSGLWIHHIWSKAEGVEIVTGIVSVLLLLLLLLLLLYS